MLTGLLGSTLQADTQVLTTSARFVTPLSFDINAQPDFGVLEAGPAGRQFILATDGSINGADASAYQGGAEAGSLDLKGSTTQSIDIQAGNAQDNNGASLSNFTCDYGGSGETDCISGISNAPPPGNTGTTLLVGMELTTTQEHNPGDTAAPTFDIVVTYH